jgi:hypothetical protein
VGPIPPPQGSYPPPPGGYPVPPRRSGLSLGAFLGIIFGCAVFVLGAALATMIVLFLRQRGDTEIAARVAAERAAQHGQESSKSPAPDLPSVTRHVPNHSLRVLEGCTDGNLSTISIVLADAIDVGAPAYNEGKFDDCYRTYVGAALDLEKQLPKTCAGPAKALANGRQTASGLTRSSDQAWAMRDAFDGLLEVIAKSRQGGGTSL